MLTVGELKNILEEYDDNTKIMIKSSYYGYSCEVEEMDFEDFDDETKDGKVIAIIEGSQKGHLN